MPTGNPGQPRPRRWLAYNNETMSAAAWARRTGIPANVISYRRRQGWSVEAILTTPAHASSFPARVAAYLAQQENKARHAGS